MCRVLLAVFFFSSFFESVICEDIWAALNKSVSGHLHSATPLSLPCFSVYEGRPVTPNAEACAQIQANYTSSDYRAEFYNGFMNNQDEVCFTNTTDRCTLNNASPTDPTAFTNVSCNQGSVSKYYIEVESASDVVAALKFSKKTGVRLSIKNSGHDYVARNNRKGSLALWVRKLTNMSHDPSFVPEGCNASSSVNAITTAAGVNTNEVYEFAEAHNVTYIGGYATTIGVAGGWVQGGGHSVLSPVYGLGIDRVVQFKVVTPDGVLRVANACQNPDLFWALRGGGGGTFGVVMEATARVEPRFPLAVAYIRYAQTPSNIMEWLSIIVNNSLLWANQGWGGHYQSTNIIAVTPLLNLTEAIETMKPATEFAEANNGSSVVELLPSWYGFYVKYVTPNEAAVGGLRPLAGRLVPASAFNSTTGRTKLMGFLQTLVSLGRTIYIPNTTPWLYPWKEGSTSATPAWRDTLWELGYGGTWTYNSTIQQRKSQISTINNLTTVIKDATGSTGGYLNEDFPWATDWKEAWWGTENYDKLLAIKRKYDPDSLLNCWKCVGFEEETAEEQFPCLQIAP
ncbi:isoamyl alcohol oxidase protein [Rutstroemia sp. NJR-2017a BVV2]|nr:isoamyl alcohol oxidase protein [Rutstroemia sp. NJR-2017a BVV2]